MKRNLSHIFIPWFLFLCSSVFVFSQSQEKVELLENKLNETTDFKELIGYYDEIFKYYVKVDFEKAKQFNESLEKLNAKGNCPECKCLAELQKGLIKDYEGDIPAAIEHYNYVVLNSRELNNYELYFKGVLGKLELMILEGIDLEESEKELDEFLKSAKENLWDINFSQFYSLYAMINFTHGYLYLTKDYYLKAEEFLNQNKKHDSPNLRSAIYNNISQIYKVLKDYDKAVEYYQKALKIAENSEDKYSLYTTKAFGAKIDFDRKQYQKALDTALEYFPYFEELEDSYYLYLIGNLIGKAYYELEDYHNAEKYMLIAEENILGRGTEIEIAHILSLKSKIYVRLNNLEQANVDLLEARKLIKSIPVSNTTIDVLNSEILYYEAISQYSKLQELYKEKDSVQNIVHENANQTRINELEIQYQTAQKEQEIAFLNTQNELVLVKSKNQRNLYLSLLGLAILAGLMLFYTYRERLQTAEKIKELDQLKTRFFSNISHEFRTPLTLIKSPLQGLQKEEVEPDKKKKLKLIDQNTNRLMQLVEQLLDLSKIEGNKAQFLFKNTRLNIFLENLIEPYVYQAEEKQIDFHKNLNIDRNGWVDQDILEKIMSNLLGNALKYTPENQTVFFNGEIEGDHLKLQVKNTGVTLKSSNINKLFERFYQEESNTPGAGIGLALTKELIVEMNGKITPHYAKNELSFEVLLPITKEKLKIPNAVFIEEEETTSQTSQKKLSTEKQLMLIVDDNPSVCTVISDVFKNDFQILLAHNGKDAFEKATSQIPDIIITDVMMPVMDGFALTKMLRKNELTSFIPLVMLTAKTDDETHLQALKLNADAFVSKPFNNDILFEKVTQLLESRKQLQERYSQELVLIPQDVEVPDLDKEFLEKVQKIMEAQLSNPEFTADDLASQLAVSRMQLHRKLKSITGLSSLEFIKNYRLQTAKILLSSSKLQVAEVAYSVGFNNAKYFSKCYKELFGTLPSQK